MNPSRRLLVTAGPTRQPLDAVRFLSNRSSGAMGVAIAKAGAEAGWETTLLLGPIDRPAPRPRENLSVDRFETFDDLADLLDRHFPDCDTLIMAAAVGDYRLLPDQPMPAKLPRDPAGLTLRLSPTPDLVAAAAGRKRADQFVIAFSLESPDTLAERAAGKLQKKTVDAIIANPLDTLGSDSIDPVLLTADGSRYRTGPLTKVLFARRLIAWLDGKGEL